MNSFASTKRMRRRGLRAGTAVLVVAASLGLNGCAQKPDAILDFQPAIYSPHGIPSAAGPRQPIGKNVAFEVPKGLQEAIKHDGELAATPVRAHARELASNSYCALEVAYEYRAGFLEQASKIPERIRTLLDEEHSSGDLDDDEYRDLMKQNAEVPHSFWVFAMLGSGGLDDRAIREIMPTVSGNNAVQSLKDFDAKNPPGDDGEVIIYLSDDAKTVVTVAECSLGSFELVDSPYGTSYSPFFVVVQRRDTAGEFVRLIEAPLTLMKSGDIAMPPQVVVHGYFQDPNGDWLAER